MLCILISEEIFGITCDTIFLYAKSIARLRLKFIYVIQYAIIIFSIVPYSLKYNNFYYYILIFFKWKKYIYKFT